jgi:two-component system response regulator YesN
MEYKIVLVEDEDLIRNKIKTLIINSGLKVLITGEYRNGADALSAFSREGIPEIIITDICMPVISGIELAEKVHKMDKNAKVILVSGYADFEYAKQAMSIGVKQYLLKPIKSSELKSAISEVCTELDMQRSMETSRKSLFESSLLFRRQNAVSILSKIIINSMGNAGLKEQFFSKYPAYNYEFFTLIIINVYAISEPISSDYYISIIKEIRDFTDTFLPLNENIFELSHNSQSNRFIIFIGGNSKEENNNNCSLIVNSLLEKGSEELKERVRVAYSIADRENISSLYEQCNNALLKRFISSENVIPYSDFETNRKELQNRLSEIHGRFFSILKNIASYSKSDAASEILSISDILFTQKAVINYGFINIRMLLIEFFSNTLPVITHFYEGFSDIISPKLFSGEIIDNFLDLAELIAYVKRIIKEILSSENPVANSTIVSKAIKIINEKYPFELSLTYVAECLFINPSYLSRIFSEKAGVNFSTYVNSVRIEKAKYLLASSKNDIVSIALGTGFNNQQYFTRQFKNYTGNTPLEYRMMSTGKPPDINFKST